MDRNSCWLLACFSARVALRKESVDRNHAVLVVPSGCWVALRKESVDRNNTMQVVIIIVHAVALRKESVDRNLPQSILPYLSMASLSARRAWIEIETAETAKTSNAGRSPQGERG